MTTKNTKIQLGRAARQSTLESANPILLAGEPVIALDTGILKIGDGVNTYQNLPSIGTGGDLSDYVSKTELATELEGYVESTDLATVATSGSYNDLTNKPNIPAAQVQSDWNQSDSTAVDYIKNKPTIPSTSGFVDTTTNQSIGGVKTFTRGIILSNTNGTASILNNGSVQFSLVLDASGKAGLITTNQTDYKIYTTNNDFLLDTSMIDGTTLEYDNVNNVVKNNSVTIRRWS